MRILLLLCFALSGVSGLIYEVLWTRKLGFIFGSTAVAVGVCLAVYLAGLALGSYFSGPIADRMARPARTFAMMQLAIGVGGLLSLPLLDAAGWAFARFEPLAFPLVALALLAPTILLGASLPVLVRATQSRLTVVAATARLYFANTCGAVAGAALAGFILLPYWGMLGTAAAAAGLNLLLALPLWLAFGKGEAQPRRPASSPASNPLANTVSAPIIWMILGVSGFCALLDEVIWTRTLVPVVGNSTWSFAVMVSPFLLGLALGTLAAARLVRAPAVLHRVGPVAMLAWALSLTGTSVYLGMLIVHLLPAWFSSLYADLHDQLPSFLMSQAGVCGAISFVPAFWIGAVFPLALAVSGNPQEPARLVGRLYSINTVGGILGACLAGLVVIPLLGLRGGLLLSSSLSLATAAVLLFAADGSRLKRILTTAIPIAAGGAILYAVPAWDRNQMTVGVFNLVPFVYESGQDFLPILMQQPRIVYYREGEAGTVAVSQRGSRGVLSIDGIPEASDSSATQVLLPHYAMATGPGQHRALVIGYGSGNTAGSLALYPFEQIDVAEIEPATIEAGRFFEGVNHRPDREGRVHIHWSDGRTWLAAASSASYDLIVSQPSMPWTPASGKLFTRDFFRLAHSRLRPGGVLAQSFAFSNLNYRSVQSLLRTFADTFPNMLVVTSGRNTGELILLGSDRTLKLDWNALNQLFATPERSGDLTRGRLPDTGSTVGRVLFGTAEISALTAGAPLNTDDNGLLEFASLTDLYTDTRSANTERLYESAVDARSYLTGAPAGMETRTLLELANSSVVLHDYRRGLMYAQELLAYGDTYSSNLAAGDVLYGLRRVPEAIGKWRHSLELQPEDVPALTRLIRHYRPKWPRDRPPEYKTWIATLTAKTPPAAVAVPSEYLNGLWEPDVAK